VATWTLRFEIPPRVRARLPRGALRTRLELFSRNLLGAIPDTVIRAPIRLRVR
jgi:hypothetical protein